jgi:hypothetical protein
MLLVVPLAEPSNGQWRIVIVMVGFRLGMPAYLARARNQLPDLQDTLDDAMGTALRIDGCSGVEPRDAVGLRIPLNLPESDEPFDACVGFQCAQTSLGRD